ncbi:MAG TPA: TonB-dependent receptor, partial [Rhizomicrobium sp.]|nr:TonB-dependent receptor [Rhizomicrobium sp.]
MSRVIACAAGAMLLLASRPAAVETVVVTGMRVLPYAKLTEPILKTPQSISVVPAAIMQEQAAYDLRDVLRNDPNVSLHADEDSGQGDNITIRGFSARFDTYLDGMLDVGSYYRDGFDLQEVDVLTGPSSVLFGRGSTGGVIQQISKTPGLDPFYDASAIGSTDGTVRLAVDVNQPLSDTAALRLNALSYQGGIADRDIAHYDRIGVAPSLTIGIGTPTRLTLSFLHQSEWDVPDYGVPWIDLAGETVSQPAHVPHADFYGFTSDRAYDTVDIGTATAVHDFDSALSLRDQLRYGHYQRAYQATDPTIAAVIPAGTPLSAISVTRTMRGGFSTETTLDDQFDLTAHFAALGLDHTVVTGLEASRMTSDPTVLKFAGVPSTNLIDPDPFQPFAGTTSLKSVVRASVETLAAYAVDTMKIDRWAFTAAARLDDFNASFRNAIPAPLFLHHADLMPSYKIAAVYSLTPDASLYAVYGTSFDPSAEAVSLSGATAGLAPERSHTLEAGGKWNATEGLLVSAALFRTIMTNLREPDPLDPTVDVLEGTAQAEGLEIQAQGRVTEEWAVLAGYTYLDARILSSPNPDAGSRLQNAPRHSVKLWSTYDLPFRLTIGAGMNYQSSR